MSDLQKTNLGFQLLFQRDQNKMSLKQKKTAQHRNPTNSYALPQSPSYNNMLNTKRKIIPKIGPLISKQNTMDS